MAHPSELGPKLPYTFVRESNAGGIVGENVSGQFVASSIPRVAIFHPLSQLVPTECFNNRRRVPWYIVCIQFQQSVQHVRRLIFHKTDHSPKGRKILLIKYCLIKLLIHRANNKKIHRFYICLFIRPI